MFARFVNAISFHLRQAHLRILLWWATIHWTTKSGKTVLSWEIRVTKLPEHFPDAESNVVQFTGQRRSYALPRKAIFKGSYTLCENETKKLKRRTALERRMGYRGYR